MGTGHCANHTPRTQFAAQGNTESLSTWASARAQSGEGLRCHSRRRMIQNLLPGTRLLQVACWVVPQRDTQGRVGHFPSKLQEASGLRCHRESTGSSRRCKLSWLRTETRGSGGGEADVFSGSAHARVFHSRSARRHPRVPEVCRTFFQGSSDCSCLFHLLRQRSDFCTIACSLH